MKKCAYCGRENADDAIYCRECRTKEFVVPVPAAAPAEEGGNRSGHFLFRLLVSICVWVAVSGVSLYVAWQNARDADLLCFEQLVTRLRLRQIDAEVAQYQQDYHAAPRSLTELLEMTNAMRSSDLVDGWNRPFLFSSHGTNVLVTSYGRDGKPGGKGIDFDLTNKAPRPKESLPTFIEFLRDLPRVNGMILSCVLCGCLAFVLSFITVKLPELTHSGILDLGFKLGATILGAIIVAVLISGLHVPSGH